MYRVTRAQKFNVAFNECSPGPSNGHSLNVGSSLLGRTKVAVLNIAQLSTTNLDVLIVIDFTSL